MTERQLKVFMIRTITKVLEANIENCNFAKKLYASNKATIKTLNKSIRQSKKAIDMLPSINHIEILRAMYGDIVGKITTTLMLGGTLITSKQVQYYDKNKEGFKEFMRLEEENRQMYEQKVKEQKESAEAIKKAKEQGKKVEFVYDKDTKKVKPVIVENNNAEESK